MRKFFWFRKLMALFEMMGVDPRVGAAALAFVVMVLIAAVFWFVDTAPPKSITMLTGPEGSVFQRNAEKYRKVLEREGIKLVMVPSQGSLENLVHLADPSFKVDVGFVQGGLIQGGLAEGLDTGKLVSLGSVFYEPLMVFYRSREEINRLSQLEGRRLGIGQVGSGTHALATALLKANGIEQGGKTELLDDNPENAADALIAGKLDAVFLMGDSASVKIMGRLLRTPGIRLVNFQQADAYTRRINYLNKLGFFQGSIDLGKNIPERDIELVGPTVELVARGNLHPALSDLLLEAAHEVNGNAGLLQRQGEFPAPLQHEFRISDDADRYYKSGKSFLYRNMPFWLATFVSRIVVVIVPIIVLLIPALRMLPVVYRWRMRSRITKWYGILLELEKDLLHIQEPGKRTELIHRLDHVERAVHRIKVPRFFGDQYYVLLQHVDYVRGRLQDMER
ncbi:MAG TPA: TAXI family TRAP transporter solute-binding subunit [Gallionellaceae bacterium]